MVRTRALSHPLSGPPWGNAIQVTKNYVRIGPSRSDEKTLQADQQGCQKGLAEDHFANYWIETLRPGDVLVGVRPLLEIGTLRLREQVLAFYQL